MTMYFETDRMTGTHTFVVPNFMGSDVTVLTGISYHVHGSFSVTYAPANGTTLSAGTYNLTTTISDDVLRKDCVSTLNVTGILHKAFLLFMRM